MKSLKMSLTAISIVLMLVASAVFMCGCKKQTVIPNDPITLPLDKNYELSVWMAWDNTFCNEYETLGDHPFFKRLEEKTNITVEFQMPTSTFGDIGGASSEWSAAIASGEMTDIVMHYYFTPSLTGTTIDSAYDDELYYILNDYVSVQMPNFNSLRQKYSVIDKTMYTNMGNIMFIPSITGCADAEKAPVTEGLIVRKDFLDEVQLDVPVTINDWTNMLSEFSTTLGLSMPLALGNMPLDPVVTGSAFLSAYGCDYKFYLGEEDGMVHYGCVEDGMFEYAKLLNEWYVNNYINIDTAVTVEMKSGNDVGAWCGGIDDIANLKDTAYYSGYEVVAAPYPVLNEGDKITVRAEYMPTGNYEYNSFYVTQVCERPDIACKWIDQLFSEESYYEASYGVEGETYNKNDDGTITFTDKVLGDEDGVRYGVAKNCFLESLYCDRDVLVNYAYSEEVKEAVKVWSLATSERSLMRNTSWQYTAEEREVKDTLGNFWMIQVGNIKGFINGNTPLTEWDAYVAQMNDAGMDLYIDIVQSAYDRFMAS